MICSGQIQWSKIAHSAPDVSTLSKKEAVWQNEKSGHLYVFTWTLGLTCSLPHLLVAIIPLYPRQLVYKSSLWEHIFQARKTLENRHWNLSPTRKIRDSQNMERERTWKSTICRPWTNTIMRSLRPFWPVALLPTRFLESAISPMWIIFGMGWRLSEVLE